MEESNEDRSQKFKRLANTRVNNALRHLKLIGNLANKQNYDFNKEDSDKIIIALEGELKSLKSKFNSKKSIPNKFSID